MVHHAREHGAEFANCRRIAVDDEIAPSRMAVLGEVHQCPCAIVNVYRRNPAFGSAKLDESPNGKNRVDDPFSKPRSVAIDQSWHGRDDRESGDDVSLETIE